MEHVPSPDIIKALSLLGAEIRASALDLEGVSDKEYSNASAWMHRYVEWPDGEFTSKKAGTLVFLPPEVVTSGGKTYVSFAYSDDKDLTYALMPSSSDADPMVFKIDAEGKARGRMERFVSFMGRLKRAG